MSPDPADIFVVERTDKVLRAKLELIGISSELGLCDKSPSVFWDIRAGLG
jgi:hypothetical protein